MITIGIILLFVALIVPGYRAYMVRRELRNTDNLIVSDIRRAEEEARRVGLAGTVILNPRLPGGTVLVGGNNQVVFSHPFPPKITVTSSFRADLPCASVTAVLQVVPGSILPFNAQGIPVACGGTPLGPPTETIALTSQDGDRLMITLDTRTGEVK